jgi:prepilin-type N-terminal cleavage/methylation domain-containing protein
MIMGQRGVTLVEILVVIGIIAILLVTALSFIGWTTRYSVESSVRRVYSQALNARVRAMQRNRTHWMVVSATAVTVYEDTSPAPDGDGVLTIGDDATVSADTITSQLSLAWSGGDEIAIDARGLISGIDLVRVISDAQADLDCIATTRTKLSLGQWDGASCVPK